MYLRFILGSSLNSPKIRLYVAISHVRHHVYSQFPSFLKITRSFTIEGPCSDKWSQRFNHKMRYWRLLGGGFWECCWCSMYGGGSAGATGDDEQPRKWTTWRYNVLSRFRILWRSKKTFCLLCVIVRLSMWVVVCGRYSGSASSIWGQGRTIGDRKLVKFNMKKN